MKYATTLGAYGLAAAAAFAVALAVLVSSSTPAEAVSPGSHMDITYESGDLEGSTDLTVDPPTRARVRLRIDTEGSTASGSFASGGRQVLTCSDNTACDLDETVDQIKIRVNIDEDSPSGEIYVQRFTRSDIGAVTVVAETAVSVSAANPAVAIRTVPGTSADPNPSKKAIDKDGDDGGTDIQVQLLNAKSKGVNGRITVTTTRGVLNTSGSDGDPANACTDSDDPDSDPDTGVVANGLGSCAVTTAGTGDDTGKATVSLFGNGLAGVATLTFTHPGGVSHSVDIVIHGSAGAITADGDVSTVELGGKFYVEVSITDSGGNAVQGYNSIGIEKVTGPEDDSNPVKALANGEAEPRTNADKSTTPLCFQQLEDPANAGTFLDAVGTNSKGVCVIHMEADNPPGTADDASRGQHTIVIDGGFKSGADDEKDQVSVAVNVSGNPDSITTNAPESVEPLSETKVTVTVQDDDGELVGGTNISVRLVDGGGLVEGLEPSSTDPKRTKDGKASFTYFAPATEGTAVFVIDAGSGSTKKRESVTIQIGEAMPETPEEPDPPAMPEGDATLSVQGPLGSFSGGSIAEFAAAVEAACPGGATIYVAVSLDDWGTPYVSDATIPLVNATFAARFPSGLAAGTLVAVTRCEADAMEDEG